MSADVLSPQPPLSLNGDDGVSSGSGADTPPAATTTTSSSAAVAALPPTTPRQLRGTGHSWLLEVGNPVAFVAECPHEKLPQLWQRLLRSCEAAFRPKEAGGGLSSASLEQQAVATCRLLQQYPGTGQSLCADVVAAACLIEENLLALYDYAEVQAAAAECLTALLRTEAVPSQHILRNLVLRQVWICGHKATTEDVRRLHDIRRFLSEIDWATADEFAGYCAGLLNDRFLAFGAKASDVVAELFRQDAALSRSLHRALLPVVFERARRRDKALPLYVETVLRVWDGLEGLHLAVFEHEVARPFVTMAAGSDPRVFPPFKAILAALAGHARATAKTRAALKRLLQQSDLLGNVDAPNAVLRRNSVSLLGDHFPLAAAGCSVGGGGGRADVERAKVDQFHVVRAALSDPAPNVRAAAAAALCRVVAQEWAAAGGGGLSKALLLPPLDALFTKLAYDRTDANVRWTVLTQARETLLPHPLLHEVLRTLLRGLRHLNDSNASVRLAFTSLLVDLLKQPFFDVSDVVSDDHIVRRLGVETKKAVVDNLITLVRGWSVKVWVADDGPRAGEMPEAEEKLVLKTLLVISARYPAAAVVLYSGLVKTTRNLRAAAQVVRATLWWVTRARNADVRRVEHLLAVVGGMVSALAARLLGRRDSRSARVRAALLAGPLAADALAEVDERYDTIATKQLLNAIRSSAHDLAVNDAAIAAAAAAAAAASQQPDEPLHDEDAAAAAAAAAPSASVLVERFANAVAADNAATDASRAAAAAEAAAAAAAEAEQEAAGVAASQLSCASSRKRGRPSKAAVAAAAAAQASAPTAPGVTWKLLLCRIVAEGNTAALTGSLAVAAELLHKPAGRATVATDPNWNVVMTKLSARVGDITRLLRSSACRETTDAQSRSHAAVVELYGRLAVHRASAVAEHEASVASAAAATSAPATQPPSASTRRGTQPSAAAAAAAVPVVPAGELSTVIKELTGSVLMACRAGDHNGGGAKAALCRFLLAEQVVLFATECVRCYVVAQRRRRRKKKQQPPKAAAAAASTQEALPRTGEEGVEMEEGVEKEGGEAMEVDGEEEDEEEEVVDLRTTASLDGGLLVERCLEVNPKLLPRLLAFFNACFEMQCTGPVLGHADADEWGGWFVESVVQPVVTAADVAYPVDAATCWTPDAADLGRERGWRALEEGGLFAGNLVTTLASMVRSRGIGDAAGRALKAFYGERVFARVLLGGGGTHLLYVAAELAVRFKHVGANVAGMVSELLARTHAAGVDLTARQRTGVLHLVSLLLSYKSRPLTQLLVQMRDTFLVPFFESYKVLLLARGDDAGADLEGRELFSQEMFGSSDDDDESGGGGSQQQQQQGAGAAAQPTPTSTSTHFTRLWEGLESLDWTVPLPKVSAASVKRSQEAAASQQLEEEEEAAAAEAAAAEAEAGAEDASVAGLGEESAGAAGSQPTGRPSSASQLAAVGNPLAAAVQAAADADDDDGGAVAADAAAAPASSSQTAAAAAEADEDPDAEILQNAVNHVPLHARVAAVAAAAEEKKAEKERKREEREAARQAKKAERDAEKAERARVRQEEKEAKKAAKEDEKKEKKKKAGPRKRKADDGDDEETGAADAAAAAAAEGSASQEEKKAEAPAGKPKRKKARRGA